MARRRWASASRKPSSWRKASWRRAIKKKCVNKEEVIMSIQEVVKKEEGAGIEEDLVSKASAMRKRPLPGTKQRTAGPRSPVRLLLNAIKFKAKTTLNSRAFWLFFFWFQL